jgi:hypothetical protein
MPIGELQTLSTRTDWAGYRPADPNGQAEIGWRPLDRFADSSTRHSSARRSGMTRIEHPLVGPLQLSYEKLPIPDTDVVTRPELAEVLAPDRELADQFVEAGIVDVGANQRPQARDTKSIGRL